MHKSSASTLRVSLAILVAVLAALLAGCASEEADPDLVDLTELNYNIVYAQISNILSNPAAYMGKTIKLRGSYESAYYDETGKHYHYVLVEDVSACCAQGMEFIWSGEHTYPDDYPEKKKRIELSGVFGSYEELSQTYYYLAVDDIVVLT